MNKNVLNGLRERKDWESLFLYLESCYEYDLIIELYNELKGSGEILSDFIERHVYDAYKYKDNPDLRFQPEEF